MKAGRVGGRNKMNDQDRKPEWKDVPFPQPKPLEDPINPSHYQGDYVMRVIEDFKLGFHIGTVVKYLLRAGNKDGNSELQDLKKAKWYLERKIEKLEKENNQR